MPAAEHVPLAPLDDVPFQGLLAVESDIGSMLLYRDGGGVRGWLNACPHAGRRLDWAPGQFLLDGEGQLLCAVHGAAFELVEGRCVAGPCRGQSLQPVPLRVEDGQVRLADAAAGH